MLRLPSLKVFTETAARHKYLTLASFCYLLLLYKITFKFFLICRFNNSSRYQSKKPETYYDVLNVHHDCNKRDIRNAYLKLSKQVQQVFHLLICINKLYTYL